jgi:hypothetical protein
MQPGAAAGVNRRCAARPQICNRPVLVEAFDSNRKMIEAGICALAQRQVLARDTAPFS